MKKNLPMQYGGSFFIPFLCLIALCWFLVLPRLGERQRAPKTEGMRSIVRTPSLPVSTVEKTKGAERKPYRLIPRPDPHRVFPASSQGKSDTVVKTSKLKQPPMPHVVASTPPVAQRQARSRQPQSSPTVRVDNAAGSRTYALTGIVTFNGIRYAFIEEPTNRKAHFAVKQGDMVFGMEVTDVSDNAVTLTSGSNFLRLTLGETQRKLEEAAAEKARVNGKYSVLLQKISVPQDKNSYGDFHESNFWSGTEYAGFTDLPKGYWVYVYPDWYIWQNKTGD